MTWAAAASKGSSGAIKTDLKISNGCIGRRYFDDSPFLQHNIEMTTRL